MKNTLYTSLKALCLTSAVLTSLLVVSCQQVEPVDSVLGSIRYDVSCAKIDAGPALRSGLSYFQDSDIPLSLSTYEGIDVSSIKAEEPQTRGTLYNDEEALSTFYVTAYNGYEELFYRNRVVKENGEWKADERVDWPYGYSLQFLAYANPLANNFEVINTPFESTMSVTIPEKAGDQSDILWGYYSGQGNPAGTADIKFQHPMTAVVFKLGDVKVPTLGEEVDVKVTSITLTGVANSGVFTTTTTVDSEDAYWTVPADDTYGLVVSQKEATSGKGIPVAEDGTIGDAFLLIPQDLAEHNVRVDVVLSIKPSGNAVTYNFCAKLNSDNWEMGHTNVYTIGYEEALSDFKFSLDRKSVDFTFTKATDAQVVKVTSNGYDGYSSTSHVRKPVEFDIDYSIDGGETWAPYDAEAQENSGITSTISMASGATAHTLTLTATPSSIAKEMPIYRWISDEEEADAWDLSRCAVGGDGYSESNPQNTANTYIVKHPGSYRIPCVYGNSVKNGAATTAGYISSASGASVMPHMLNAIGGEISSAYILEDLKDMEDFHPRAALLWTDTKDGDNLMIKDVVLNNAATPESAYISFSTVDKSALLQGNAVIILYNDKDNNGSYNPYDITTTPETSTSSTTTHYTTANLLSQDIVLWSWHIWITDADLSPAHTLAIGDNHLMSRFLGWNDGDTDGVATRYVAPEGFEYFKIRVTQKITGKSEVVDIYQKEGFTVCSKGSVPYYQYGRSVPSIGTYTTVSEPKPFFYADGSAVPVSTSSPYLPAQISSSKDDPIFHYGTSSKTYEQAITYTVNGIKLPQIYVWSANMDKTFTNLWSLNNSGFDDTVETVKTIYDPCPYGYKIPSAGLMKPVIDDKAVKLPGGEAWILYDKDQDFTMIFPRTGYRDSDRSLESNTFSCWMTSSIYNVNNTKFEYYGTSSTSKVITSTYKAKGIAAPILPILDE